MSDLIKRDDALATIDTFKRDFEQSWKVQFSADIKALPAINPADRIEELERDYEEACNESADCYIMQCRAEDKLTKAVEALRNILKGDYNWSMAREVLAELEKTE